MIIPDRITHTTAFVTPVVEHWVEREIAQWVHPMKDRSDDPSHHEQTLYLWATSRSCGVSNAMDGTEDAMLFDELVCGPEQVPEWPGDRSGFIDRDRWRTAGLLWRWYWTFRQCYRVPFPKWRWGRRVCQLDSKQFARMRICDFDVLMDHQ